MDSTKVIIEAEINPTESEEKVKKAIWNLFGDVPMQIEPAQKGSTITAQTIGLESLAVLRNILYRDRIRDAARKALIRGMREGTLTFYLNKQVAFAGHVSFSEPEAESPLGPIKITILSDDISQIVSWMAEKTGRP